MRILVVCKRQYTNKDLIDDRYGRLYELPESLALQGNDVRGICASYRNRKTGTFQPGLVSWQSINTIPFLNTASYSAFIGRCIREFCPDVLWVSSDAWQIIVASSLAKTFHIPYIADLYDNYESFALTRLPFVRTAFRNACRQASALAVVSSTLKCYLLGQGGHEDHPIEVIGNAINPDIFFSFDKFAARKLLNLPRDGILIGTAGAISNNRGIQVLFEAFIMLAKSMPFLHLVTAGQKDRTIKQYQHPRIIDLGVLTSDKIPALWNALDLAIICNRDSEFGRYCYPQKYNEIRACETPLLAADVGEVSRLLDNEKKSLFNPTSANNLADAISETLRTMQDTSPPITAPASWSEMGNHLSDLLKSILENRTKS